MMSQNSMNNERNFSPEQKRTIFVESNIKSADGQISQLKVELGPDGKPKAAAFFDIDGTLAHLKFVHGQAIQELFPGNDPEELAQTFFSGFKLGNSFREFNRMYGIYVDGHTEWKDPEVYRREELLPHQEEIDNKGHEKHDRAAEYLQRYGLAAAKIMKGMYAKEPQKFEEAKIKPIFRLAEIYKRLGIPMGVMTANPRALMDPITKYLRFSNYFIDISTDEDMIGGGKEISIQDLKRKMEAKGIPVPTDRLILVGDSIRGDVGVGMKLPKDWQPKIKGLVVLDNQEALARLQSQIQGDSDLQKQVSAIDTSALVVESVPLDSKGKPKLTSRFRDKFLTKL
jgi:phosphoglycolate phosphatase-like HAD superfamily hydrolase